MKTHMKEQDVAKEKGVDGRHGPLIVVGVDGSASSLQALDWALDQARATGASLRAVTAWTFPNEPTPFDIVPDLPPRPDELTKVQHALDREVAGRRDPAHPLSIETTVVPGRAGVVLVDAARKAALLVVGSRGRRAVTEFLLGSVSEFCVRHAPCPVVVVRHVPTP